MIFPVKGMLGAQLPPPDAPAQDPPALLLKPSAAHYRPEPPSTNRPSCWSPAQRLAKLSTNPRHTHRTLIQPAMPLSAAPLHRTHITHQHPQPRPLLWAWQRQEITSASTHLAPSGVTSTGIVVCSPVHWHGPPVAGVMYLRRPQRSCKIRYPLHTQCMPC